VLDYGTIGKIDKTLSLVAQARYTITNRREPTLAQKLIDELRALKPGMPEADLLQAELWITTKQDIPGAKKLLEGVLQMPNAVNWIVERAKELQRMTR